MDPVTGKDPSTGKKPDIAKKFVPIIGGEGNTIDGRVLRKDPNQKNQKGFKFL